MNIFLIPYNWFRHVQVSLVTGSAAVLGWWAVLTVFSLLGPVWPQGFDGAVFLGVVSGAIGGGAIFAEGGLRRWGVARWFGATAAAAGLSGGIAFGLGAAWGPISRFLFSQIAAEPELVSLSFQLGAWGLAGLASAVGPIVLRKGADLFNQIGAGLAGGLAGAAAWHSCEYRWFLDLYLAGALGALAWGVTFGLLAWGIPDALYAGWLRVIGGERMGRRIPIDALDGGQRERFVGHFPRGLDLWLRNTDGEANAQGMVGARGVQELHLSVRREEGHRFIARGLSIFPTEVRRPLARIDLHYDANRDRPLQTTLQSGDRIRLGEGEHQVELEFLMLPREEQ